MRWVVPERFLGTDYAELHGFRELHGLVRIIQNLRINTDYTDFRNYTDISTDYTEFTNLIRITRISWKCKRRVMLSERTKNKANP